MLVLSAILALMTADPSNVADLSRPSGLLPGFSVDLPDYPHPDYEHGNEGRVRFVLDVAADGTPTNCTIILPTKFAGLNKRACKIAVARMRFSPALDETGKPVASQSTQTILWKIRHGG